MKNDRKSKTEELLKWCREFSKRQAEKLGRENNETSKDKE